MSARTVDLVFDRQKNPEMKILFDAPSVVAGAGDVIHAHGVGERCDSIGQIVSVPAGGDAYIIKHIIHNWDDDRASGDPPELPPGR